MPETSTNRQLTEADGRQLAARYLHAFQWEEGNLDPKPFFSDMPPEYNFLLPLLQSLAHEPAALRGFTSVVNDALWETAICGAGPSNPVERYCSRLAPPKPEVERLCAEIDARMRAPVDPAFEKFMSSIEPLTSGRR